MTNDSMTKEITMTKSQNNKYDLKERTEKFAGEILSFAKKIPTDNITNPLINQLIRAATSVGANYCEADDALTRKDFIYRIGVCRKEAKETLYWLKIVIVAMPSLAEISNSLLSEAKQLNLIFSSIINKMIH